MFKTIPGNHNLTISLNGEIRTINGKVPELKIQNGKAEIELYGKVRIIDLEWLSLISFYEANLPDKYIERLFDIKFVNINHKVTKSITGKIMIFENHFMIDGLFRIIPGFLKYCISKEGVVKEITTNKVIEVSYSSQYPKVYIYNPEKNSIDSLSVHRLVALAWCRNIDYLEKPIVNHIDGNKNNFHYKNLEWCSFKENSIHAFKTGLRSDNRIYKVKDHKTGNVKIYTSFRDVCIDLGIDRDQRFRNIQYKRKKRLIFDRYEIKLNDDMTPWLSDQELDVKKGMYHTKVTYPDGSIEEFHDTRDIMKKLRIWNVSSNIKNIIEKAKIMYPGIKFDVKNNYEVLAVQALEINTGKIIEANSIREMSRKLEISFSEVRIAVIHNPGRILKGYVFRYKSDLPWGDNFTSCVSMSKKIEALNCITGETIVFNSLRSTSKYFHIDRSVIKNRLMSGDKFDDWLFKEID